MKYRREIDGLRALAVFPVILFHAGIQSFGGGFVGVDVFFVISGYLITSIILLENENGTFSLINFYERRLRRILPALFAVMLACIPFAWYLFLPEDMKSFSQSLVATSVYLANLFFWKTSGYFATATELKPLLHTWSLAIEEQYYLLFPILITLIWKWGERWLLLLLGVIAFCSFIAIQFLSSTTAFYLLPTRAWELLMGALVAIYLIRKPSNQGGNKTRSKFGDVIGLALLVYSVLVFDKHTPFPSTYSLIPTIGTLLIILYSSENTLVGKLLGSKPLVSIGLVSYSAYLWHQPLFAFLRIKTSSSLSELSLLVLICVTFVLAYISWKYIETPFRNKKKFNRRQVFLYSGLGSVFFITFGLIGHFSNGYATLRFSDVELEKLNSFKRSHLEVCSFDACNLSSANKDDWVLVGDSNAYHFSVPLNEVVTNKGKRLFNLAKGGCIPVLGFERRDQLPEFNRGCHEHYAKVRKYLLSKDSPQNVIISSAWGYYFYGDQYPVNDGFEKFYNTQVYPSGKKSISEDQRIKAIANAIKKEVAAFSKANKNIVLIYPIPFLQSELPHNSERLSWNAHYKSQLFERRNAALIQAFDLLSGLPNVKTYRPDKVLCDFDSRRACMSVIEGKSLYGDRAHLSDFGARKVFLPFFESHIN